MEAVTVASPRPVAVASPLGLTVASAGFTDQVARDVTSRLVPSLKWALATNCWLPPTPGMVAGFGVTVTVCNVAGADPAATFFTTMLSMATPQVCPGRGNLQSAEESSV